MITLNLPQFDSQTLASYASSLKPLISSLSDTFSSSTDSVFSSAEVYAESIEEWAKENNQLATITAIAFAALGIIATFALVSLAATIVHAAIVGLASTLCFASCCTIGYFLARQALSTFHPGVEIVQGTPPYILPNDIVGQARYRKKVMQDTLAHLNAGAYASPDGTLHTFNLRRASDGVVIVTGAGAKEQRPGHGQSKFW